MRSKEQGAKALETRQHLKWRDWPDELDIRQRAAFLGCSGGIEDDV
jgi:hypothetical protein